LFVPSNWEFLSSASKYVHTTAKKKLKLLIVQDKYAPMFGCNSLKCYSKNSESTVVRVYICYTLCAGQDCWAILAFVPEYCNNNNNNNNNKAKKDRSVIKMSLALSSNERKYTL
jgi:hypothetical protein